MKSRKWLILLSLAGVLIMIALVVFVSVPPPPPPAFPSPNGYEDFLKASALLAVNSPDYSDLSEEKLRQRVTQNRPALQLVRTGLSRECRVPLEFTKDYMDDGGMSKHLPELASIKALASALKAEGRLAELEHRNADGAKAHLDTIRLGQESMRGGVLIDGLVGIACEAIGAAGLEHAVTNLDAGTCRQVTGDLERIDEKTVSFAEVTANEQAWARRSFPFYQRAMSRVVELFFQPASSRLVKQKALQKFQVREKRLRALIIALAARAYELENGKPPQSAKELVPEYLKAIPKDPVTGADMVISP